MAPIYPAPPVTNIFYFSLLFKANNSVKQFILFILMLINIKPCTNILVHTDLIIAQQLNQLRLYFIKLPQPFKIYEHKTININI